MEAILVLVVVVGLLAALGRRRGWRLQSVMPILRMWVEGSPTVAQVARVSAANIRRSFGDAPVRGRATVGLPPVMWSTVMKDLDELTRLTSQLLIDEIDQRDELRIAFRPTALARVEVTRELPYAGGTLPASARGIASDELVAVLVEEPEDAVGAQLPVAWLVTDDERWPIVPGVPLNVGRAADADVVLEDRFVSERHAIVDVDEMGPTIVDQRSKNGTFVNDMRITACRLRDRDTIRLGDTTLVVVFDRSRHARRAEGQDLGSTLDDPTSRLPHTAPYDVPIDEPEQARASDRPLVDRSTSPGTLDVGQDPDERRS